LHLKFFDRDTLEVVAESRRQAIVDAMNLNPDNNLKKDPWTRILHEYQNIIDSTTLEGEDIELPEFRAAMLKQVEKHSQQYIWGQVQGKKLYRIPERFAAIY